MKTLNSAYFALTLTLLIPSVGKAQDVHGMSDLYYSDTNEIGAWSETVADYSTAYYYDVGVSAMVLQNGVWVAGQGACCTGSSTGVWIEVPSVPGATYTVVSDHYADVYYTVYDLGYYCTWDCYSWGDVYGYSFVGCLPDYPEYLCDPPVFTTTGTTTIPSGRVWPAPVSPAVILLAQVFLGQTVKSATAEDLLPPTLVVTSNGQQISSGQTVYINPNPQVPTIQAHLVGPSAANGMVSFRLSIQFNGVTKNYPAQFPNNLFGSETWTAPWSEFWGGEATIHWTFNGIAQPDFNFKVRGQNPSESTAGQLLSDSGIWFAKNIAIHETNMAQFCEPGVAQVGYCQSSSNDGLPIFGQPNGYGMMQLDNPSPTDTQKWNWQANVEGGIAFIQTKAGPPTYTSESDARAYPFWIRQVKQWQEWNASHPTSQVAAPADQEESSYCTFTVSLVGAPTYSTPNTGQQNKYWFGDAVMIKQYGGAPTNYISWNNVTNPQSPVWSFNKANSVDENVVYEVCTCGTRATCTH